LHSTQHDPDLRPIRAATEIHAKFTFLCNLKLDVTEIYVKNNACGPHLVIGMPFYFQEKKLF
jgi:hypothetical protein